MTRGRLRHRLATAGLVVLALFAGCTRLAITYDAATAARASPPPGLRYVRTGDAQTRFRIWGSHGSPIVLVPGAFESADTWDRLAPLLAADHRVYAYDMLPFGYSRGPGPYSVTRLTAQLLAFLDAMRLGQPGRPRVLLVAHSLGAGIAAEATLRAPGRVAGLMFLDGDGTPVSAVPSVVISALFYPFGVAVLRLGLRSDWVIRTVYRQACGPKCAELDRAGVERWRRPLQQPGAEAALRTLTEHGIPGLSARRLAQLRLLALPKSVVFGQDDRQFSQQAPAQVAALIGAPVVIPDAGHLSMIAAPEAVAAAVEQLGR